MRLEKASPDTDAELRSFYEKFPLTTFLDMQIRRPKNFFAPYELQSNDYESLILRDKDNEIQGLGTFVYRDTFFEDHIHKIAFATDLRIAGSRKAILNWSQHFLPLLRDAIKGRGLTSVFSVINSHDIAAYNAFVRPRMIRRPMPRYHLYRKFQLVTLHGKFPWAPEPLPSLRIRKGEERWLGPLLDYIRRRAPYRAFTSAWDEKSFFQKMLRLPGFRLENFWLAFDSNDRIVGSLAPWSPLGIQEYCPLSYGLRAHNFRQFLKFGRVFGWTRPLTKPSSRTGEEAPLKFQFLTFVSADNEDIFESLLWHAYEELPRDEFLVYGHSYQDFRLHPPLSWVSAKIPLGLYVLVPPEMDPPSFLHPSHQLNPEIEACYLF